MSILIYINLCQFLNNSFHKVQQICTIEWI